MKSKEELDAEKTILELINDRISELEKQTMLALKEIEKRSILLDKKQGNNNP